MERQDDDDHNRAQVAQGNAGSGHLRADLMPIGLAAGAAPVQPTLESKLAFRPDRPIAPQLLPHNTAARNAFLRHSGTIRPDRPAHSLIARSAKWLLAFRETAILWGD